MVSQLTPSQRQTLGAVLAVAAVGLLVLGTAPTSPVIAVVAAVLLVLACLAVPSVSEVRRQIEEDIERQMAEADRRADEELRTLVRDTHRRQERQP